MGRHPITRDRLLQVLARHTGAAAGVHVRDLARECIDWRTTDAADERRIRDLIVALRLDGHPVCGRPETGYFIALTSGELDECCEWLLGRSMTTLSQIARMRRVATPDLRGQLRLPNTMTPEAS